MSLFDQIVQQSKGILKSFQSVSSVVGIDIGTSAVKAVQLKKDGAKIVLETYGEISLASYAGASAGQVVVLPPEKIAQAVTDVLREANVTTKQLMFSIQSQATLVFVVTLPNVSESEIAKIIPNEARKYIPVPLTEVSLDWYTIPKKQTYSEEASISAGQKEMKEVVVVAVRNETLSQYKQINDALHMSSRGNEIEIFSAIRSLFHREISPTMVIDYGAGTTKVSIVEYGVVRAYHVINRGSAFISEALARSLTISFEKAEITKKEIGLFAESEKDQPIASAIMVNTQYIINEIQSILLRYERSSQKALTKIILTGGGSHLKGFKEKVAESFGVETIMGNPFIKSDAPEFMRPVLENAGPEFTVAVGLALKDFL